MTERASSHGDFLASLSPRVRTRVVSRAQSFHYLPGEVIIREGDPSFFLYVVKSGCVALDIALASNRRLTLATVGLGVCTPWTNPLPAR